MKIYEVFVGEDGCFNDKYEGNNIKEIVNKVILHNLEELDLTICSEDEEEMIAAYNNFDGSWQIDYFKSNCFNIDHQEIINIDDIR